MNKKICFIGDQHQNTTNFINLLNHIELKQNPDCYIQVGDFGLMGHNFLNYVFKINKTLSEHKKVMYIIDGNHENHHWLKKQIQDKTQVNLASNIIYLKRGSILNIFNKNLLFMGGAYSIDRIYRQLNKTYWTEEVISDDDVEYALSHNKNIDIMVCHDVPANYYNYYLKNNIPQIKNDTDSNINRMCLYEIWNKYKPELIIHGHYHINYQFQDEHSLVVGLNCDETPLNEQYYILNI